MRYTIAAACCLISLAACGRDAARTEEVHVPFDPSDRLESSIRIEASIVRRIGAAEGEGDMLGGPADINVDSNGRIHVLDFSMRELKVYGSGGTLETTFPVPKGEGPGEASWPASLTLTGDESAYFMYDLNLKRLTVFNRAFEVQNVFNPRHEPFTLTSLGDRQIVGVIVPWRLNSDSLLHVWDLGGNHVRAFLQGNSLQKKLIFDRQSDLNPTTTIAASGNRIFVTHGFPVDLEFYDLDLDSVRLVKRYFRDYESETAYEKDFYSATTESGGTTEIAKHYAAVVCANDDIVIQVIRDLEEQRAYFDIYSVNGDHLGIVDVGEQLGLEFTTTCSSKSLSPDNIVYVHSMQRGYPEILGIQLDLP